MRSPTLREASARTQILTVSGVFPPSTGPWVSVCGQHVVQASCSPAGSVHEGTSPDEPPVPMCAPIASLQYTGSPSKRSSRQAGVHRSLSLEDGERVRSVT